MSITLGEKTKDRENNRDTCSDVPSSAQIGITNDTIGWGTRTSWGEAMPLIARFTNSLENSAVRYRAQQGEAPVLVLANKLEEISLGHEKQEVIQTYVNRLDQLCRGIKYIAARDAKMFLEPVKTSGSAPMEESLLRPSAEIAEDWRQVIRDKESVFAMKGLIGDIKKLIGTVIGSDAKAQHLQKIADEITGHMERSGLDRAIAEARNTAKR